MNIIVKNSKVFFQTLKQLVLRWKLASDDNFGDTTAVFSSKKFAMYSDPMNTDIDVDVVRLPYMSSSYNNSDVVYSVKVGTSPTSSKRNAPSVSSVSDGRVISEGTVKFGTSKTTKEIEIPKTTLHAGEQIIVTMDMQRAEDKIKMPRSNGGFDSNTHVMVYDTTGSWLIGDTDFCCPAVELWGY